MMARKSKKYKIGNWKQVKNALSRISSGVRSNTPSADQNGMPADLLQEDKAETLIDLLQAEKEEAVSADLLPAEKTESVEDSSSEKRMETISEYPELFDYFRQIAAIPHGSFHTQALSSWLEQFAVQKGLPYVRDEAGNVMICRPASPGCEKAAPVALQGHIDMVCEKFASNPIDMEKEAITLIREGDWLRADGTTLGGDDGIAVAIMLSLLADDTLVCPPLECIFTVDEEVGLLGAAALDLSGLESRRMINIDSEKEGILTAACAGGAEEVCTLTARRREKKGLVLELRVSGLRGGHSGERIGEGGANADLLLARLLYRLEKSGKYCIIRIDGGTRDNAIPRDAEAELLFTGKADRSRVLEAVSTFAREIAGEYSVTDPEIRIFAQWREDEDQEGTSDIGTKKEHHMVFSRKDSRRLVRFLMTLPNGVIEYSPLYKGIPQTSLSLGIVKTLDDGVRIHSLVRSSINSQKQMLMDRIDCIAEQFGAAVETRGSYPAWELVEHSDFRDLALQVYQRLTGREAEVQVTHGGLECGLLAAKVPGLDCISVGPDMEEIHTPSERLSIPSSLRTYAFIRELLAACAV